MTDFQTAVALAWTEYTSRCGIDPSKFSDTEKLAFQAGFACGMNAGMDHATKIAAEVIGGEA